MHMQVTRLDGYMEQMQVYTVLYCTPEDVEHATAVLFRRRCLTVCIVHTYCTVTFRD